MNKQFAVLGVLVLVGLASRFAKAGQELSQNLEIGVTVRSACTVSTEKALAGAQFSGECPASIKQKLTRDYIVSGEQLVNGSGLTEQLVLTVDF